MTTADARPLPPITPETRPFWDAVRARRLLLQHCLDCDLLRFPISGICPKCLSESFDWRPVAGRGKVVSWVVFHKLYYRSFAGDPPYNVALVELEEGPRLVSNLVNVANDAIRKDLPVRMVFEDVTPDVTLFKFEPRG